VSLNDCLACSGCVTTAETILVEQHSVVDFFNKIKSFPCTVVTISPQARSSLAHYYNMNDLQVHLSLMILFYKLGAKYFFDQSLGVDLTFQAAQKEFVERYKEAQNGDAKYFIGEIDVLIFLKGNFLYCVLNVLDGSALLRRL